mmetsp:Transcript_49747/g.79252  ORF Transcript_49747/g.79252 Transcript_49747/m.79252 type:complete len:228 (-) Transcript_49747:699-1382(-)
MEHLAQEGLVKGRSNLADQFENVLDVSFLGSRAFAIHPFSKLGDAFDHNRTSEPVWSEASTLHILKQLPRAIELAGSHRCIDDGVEGNGVGLQVTKKQRLEDLVRFDEITALRIALQQCVVRDDVHLWSLLDHCFHLLQSIRDNPSAQRHIERQCVHWDSFAFHVINDANRGRPILPHAVYSKHRHVRPDGWSRLGCEKGEKVDCPAQFTNLHCEIDQAAKSDRRGL